MPNSFPFLLALLLATIYLPAQSSLPWSADTTTALPGPGNVRLTEYHLPLPQQGIERIRVTVHLDVQDGEAYLFFYGSTPRNPYLSYKESERVSSADSTDVRLCIEGLASADMDSVVVGVAFYGKGGAILQPPSVHVESISPGKPNAYVTKYLSDFFGYAKEYALDRDRMDWATLEQDATALAARADTMPQVYEALNFTLRRIDRHSFLSPPREHKGWAKGNNDEDAVDPNLKYPTGRRVEDQMVYLWVPGVSSGHAKTLDAYADSLRNLIAALDGPRVAEWVVDLRPNTGGNCWPMLSGIGPLLGPGVCGYFMQKDGSRAEAWSYREGGSYLDGKLLHQVKTPYKTINPARVAVLYGPKTSSSAEVLAIAFRGLPNTHSFGRPTGGYSTGNLTIRLSDGAAILITTSVYGDRHKTAYGAAVLPDVPVGSTSGIDAASEVAAAWLRAGR